MLIFIISKYDSSFPEYPKTTIHVPMKITSRIYGIVYFFIYYLLYIYCQTEGKKSAKGCTNRLCIVLYVFHCCNDRNQPYLTCISMDSPQNVRCLAHQQRRAEVLRFILQRTCNNTHISTCIYMSMKGYVLLFENITFTFTNSSEMMPITVTPRRTVPTVFISVTKTK